MTFTEALSSVFDDGDLVTRRAWNNRSIHLLLDDGLLCIRGYDASGRDDGKNHPLKITEQDYFAEDWEVVDA